MLIFKEAIMKKFALTTIAWIAGILLIIAAAVVIIDPFIHYHAPLGKLAAVETEERYALIGVARNMDYDTALIGSSMSENFKESWFEDGVFGEQCVKLCLQGAHFDDYNIMFNEVLQHDDVKNILFSMDTYLLTNVPGDYPTTIPYYLSDRNYLNDVYYIWNKDVLFEYLPEFLINNKWEHYSADNAYSWAHKYQFNKPTVLGIYNTQRSLQTLPEKNYDTYMDYSNHFIASITPYIESHPDVEFYFYCPPYSILFWDDSTRRGETAAEISAMINVFEHLLEYKNVRIFYFQDDTDIITDLNHYRDYSHFSQEISYMLYEDMRDGRHELTKDNYYDTLINMYDYAMQYDYESIFH